MPAEVEKMVYKGQVPWHRGGKQVDQFMTWEEAVVAGGIDWEVELVPVFVNGKEVAENKAVVRKTDGTFYKIVGTGYTPIQNRVAGKFLDELTNAGAAKFETVGSLQNGRKIWMLLNTGTLDIKGDEVKKYLLMCNSHDMSFAREIFYTGVRVVCMNTLNMARNGATEKFYTRHTRNANADWQLVKAREILGLAQKNFETFKLVFESFATKQLKAADMPLMLAAAFNTDGAIPANEIYNPIKIQMDKVEELVVLDKDEFAPHLRGSVYEAYNAVVKYTDYYKDYRKKDEDARLAGIWFGGGNAIKERALDWCKAYVK